MDAATSSRLRAGAERLGVRLDEPQLAAFGRYLELLLRWNEKINLTAITDPGEVIEKHFLDSLAVVPLAAGARTVVDVGAGAGFPGAVLAIARPELRVTLVESIRKKVSFQEALRMAGVPNLEPVCARLEQVLAGGRTFDLAVSRATFEPAEWVSRGAPLVSPGGLLVAMQALKADPIPSPPGFVAEPPIEYEVAASHRRLLRFRRQ